MLTVNLLIVKFAIFPLMTEAKLLLDKQSHRMTIGLTPMSLNRNVLAELFEIL